MSRNENSLRIVVLSGPICAGKSTLTGLLRDRYGAQVVRTRDFIKGRFPRLKDERRSLQRAGDRLDHADGGAWVREGLVRVIEAAQTGSTPKGLFVVDSVRVTSQIAAIRQAYGSAVHHVHLYAQDPELESRYFSKGSRTKELAAYQDVRSKQDRK